MPFLQCLFPVLPEQLDVSFTKGVIRRLLNFIKKKKKSWDLLNCSLNYANTRANLKYLIQITLVSLAHSFLIGYVRNQTKYTEQTYNSGKKL